MSWLNPEHVSPSDYDPNKRVDALIEKFGETANGVLNCFNYRDPLHVLFGDNTDEYVGYVERFMGGLGEREVSTLNHDDVTQIVRNSFHKDQIGKFVSEEDMAKLIHDIELGFGIIDIPEERK